MREFLVRDLEVDISRWVDVGSSTNDPLMFEHFPHSVGVANIRRFERQRMHLPRYITQGAPRAGFIQVCYSLLASMSS